MTGSATIAQYEAILEHVTYSNSSDNPNTDDRTVTWIVNDGLNDSEGVTSTITVTSVNDAPVLSGLSGVLTYTENDGARVIDNTITLTDLDNANMARATIEITGNYHSGEDSLVIAAGYTLPSGVSAIWDSSTHTLTVSGSATVAQYEAILEHVTYTNSSDNPNTDSRTVTWTVNDGIVDSAPQTSTIMVTAVDDPPVLSGLSGVLTYTENDGAKVIDNTITLTDLDNANMHHATIEITGNYHSGEDSLGIAAGYTLPSGVSAFWDSSTHTLTVSGSATVAQYEAILEHVTYTNSSDNPNTDSRTVTWTVNDGAVDCDPQTSAITVTAVNDPPVLSGLSGVLTYTENDGAKVIDDTISLTDLDNANMDHATIEITGNYHSGEDSLGIAAGYTLPSGVSAIWDSSTHTLTVSGSATVAGYGAILEHVTYTNSSDDPNTADREVTWTVNDGDAESTAQTSTIQVTAVNDAPELSGLGGALSYTENDGAKAIEASIALTDPDNANMVSATIGITNNYQNGQDTLGIDSGDLLGGVKATWDANTGVLTLTGAASKADYALMLEHVTYINSSDDPSSADRTVTWTVNDGLLDSAPQTTTIHVTAVNDAPALSDLGGTLEYIASTGAKVVDNHITLADPDNADISSATIRIAVNYVSSEDSLGIDAGDLSVGVTANWNSTSGELAITGPASKADYEFMLEHVKYINSKDAPNMDDRTVTWTVNDGADDSAAGTSTIQISVNEPPRVLYDGHGPQIHIEQEPGPFSNTSEIAPNIGHLMSLLSSGELLPPNISAGTHGATGYQSFASHLSEALFAEGGEARRQGWDNLMLILEAQKPQEPPDQLLGLRDFLNKLQDWQSGKEVNDIRLVFNADEIYLAEWFDSLMAPSDSFGIQDGAPHADLTGPSWDWTHGGSLAFDLHELRVADMLFADDSSPMNGVSAPLEGPVQSVAQVFDPDSLSVAGLLGLDQRRSAVSFR